MSYFTYNEKRYFTMLDFMESHKAKYEEEARLEKPNVG